MLKVFLEHYQKSIPLFKSMLVYQNCTTFLSPECMKLPSNRFHSQVTFDEFSCKLEWKSHFHIYIKRYFDWKLLSCINADIFPLISLDRNSALSFLFIMFETYYSVYYRGILGVSVYTLGTLFLLFLATANLSLIFPQVNVHTSTFWMNNCVSTRRFHDPDATLESLWSTNFKAFPLCCQ